MISETFSRKKVVISESIVFFFIRLLNYGRSIDFQLNNAGKILEQELQWIKDVQVCNCLESCSSGCAKSIILFYMELDCCT